MGGQSQSGGLVDMSTSMGRQNALHVTTWALELIITIFLVPSTLKMDQNEDHTVFDIGFRCIL